MESIKAVCSNCRGTGLYEGMCEEKGYPVVCLGCGGTGMEIISYIPFEKIRKREGVKGVRLAGGSCGGFGETFSYKDFLAGKVKYK